MNQQKIFVTINRACTSCKHMKNITYHNVETERCLLYKYICKFTNKEKYEYSFSVRRNEEKCGSQGKYYTSKFRNK